MGMSGRTYDSDVIGIWDLTAGPTVGVYNDLPVDVWRGFDAGEELVPGAVVGVDVHWREEEEGGEDHFEGWFKGCED